MVTQHSNSSAASVYNNVFGFSCHAWVKHKAISQNMVLHLTNLGKKWDWCDANLPQCSSNPNLFTASTKIWKYKWGTCTVFFLKLLINQTLSVRIVMFLPSISSKTKPTFFLCYSCLLHSKPRGELIEGIINSIMHTTLLTSHMYHMCTAEKHFLLLKLLQLKIRHKRCLCTTNCA